MPSKSKSQQRFFGMVDAYKKGELKNPSSKIKKAAKGMSMSDVKDFAETKHKGLPEKVEENIIRLTESDLHNIVNEAVYKILKENNFISNKSLGAMEDAFLPKKGIDILSKGVKVLRGDIRPDAYYTEGHYTNRNTDLLADAIIEYPDGKRHILMRKRRA
jgi:hypothetical protein